MKKNKIIEFINLIESSDKTNLDNVTIANLDELKSIISFTDEYNIIDFKYIIKKSIPIVERLTENYHKFNQTFFEFLSKENVDYKKIRKELHYYPSYDETKAIKFKDEISKIKTKYNYVLKLDKININVSFYSDENLNMFTDLLRIIFIFLKTFGLDMDNDISRYNNYNLRLKLDDVRRQQRLYINVGRSLRGPRRLPSDEHGLW